MVTAQKCVSVTSEKSHIITSSTLNPPTNKIMKRFYIFLLALLFTFQSLLLFSQVSLTAMTNTLRHGDILCKVEVPFVDAGDRGDDAVWQFGETTKDSRDYLQLINSNGDTIAIYEEGKILHYLVRGDTLYNKGEQSRRAYQILSRERPTLKYPFQYGDSIAGNYVGDGRYENSRYAVSGFGYTVADGEGCLTDGEDTLQHVTRLHLWDDYVLDYGKGETMHVVEERCQWYCAGYRYAVMESQRTSLYEEGTLTPIDSISYLFLPVMQMTLAEDEANDELLAALEAADAAQGQSDSNQNESGQSQGSLTAIDASLSSDGRTLTIHYQLDADTDVTFLACDIMGNLLASAQYQNKSAGDWQECLTLSRKPIGNALMLNVRCGSQQLSLKVT